MPAVWAGTHPYRPRLGSAAAAGHNNAGEGLS